MTTQPLTMTDALGRQVPVTSYEQARKVMASFHEVARQHAAGLSSDLTTARQVLPQAQQLQSQFDENLKIYQHFAAQADIESTAAAMNHIAEQTKGLSDGSE